MSNAEARLAGSIDRPSAAKGLNIQFTRSSPLIATPRPEGEREAPSKIKPRQSSVSSKSWSAPTSPNMSNIVDDLMQVQRELALLARTENMHLGARGLRTTSLKSTDDKPADETLESDGDTTVYDEESHGALDRKRVFGSERDLRTAVVERLAELRERRLVDKLAADTPHEISVALLNIVRDIGVVLKLLAMRFPLVLTALGLLVALAASAYARSMTSSILTLPPVANSSN